MLLVFQQFRHRLRGIRFKVDISLFMTEHQAIHEIIELTHYHFFRSICLVHPSRTFHIIIIEKLGRIPFQFSVHIYLVDSLQGLLLLL